MTLAAVLPSSGVKLTNEVHEVRNRYIAAAAAVGLLVGVPGAGAATHHWITGNDVKNNSLTSRDVRDGSLASKDVHNLSLHAKDFDMKVQNALKARALSGAIGGKGATGAKGATGNDGLSAFVIWQQSNPNGTETGFLAALRGDTGAAGRDGINGVNGTNGTIGTNGANGKDGVDGNDGRRRPGWRERHSECRS